MHLEYGSIFVGEQVSQTQDSILSYLMTSYEINQQSTTS